MLSPIQMLDQKRRIIYFTNIPESVVKLICPLCNGTEQNQEIGSDKFYELELNSLCSHSLDDGRELKFIRSDYTQVDVILTLNLRKILKEFHAKAICIHYSNGCKKIGTMKYIFSHQKICIYNKKMKNAFLIAKFMRKKFIKNKLLTIKIVNDNRRKNNARKMLKFHRFLNNNYFNKIILIVFKFYDLHFLSLSYYFKFFKNINKLSIKYDDVDYYQHIKPCLESIAALENLKIGKRMKYPLPYGIFWNRLENLPRLSNKMKSLVIVIEEPQLLVYINKYFDWLLKNNNLLNSFSLINKIFHYKETLPKENVEKLFYLLNRMRLLKEISFIQIDLKELNLHILIDFQSHIEKLYCKGYMATFSLGLAYSIMDQYNKSKNYNISQILFKESENFYWFFNLVEYYGKINKIKVLKLNIKIQIEHILELIDPNYIEELCLSNTKICEDEVFSFVSKLENCKKLQNLNLSFNFSDSCYLFCQNDLPIKNSFIQSLVESLIILPTLQMINLTNVFLTIETSSEILKLIVNIKTLKKIEINFINIGESSNIYTSLCEKIRNKTLYRKGLSCKLSNNDDNVFSITNN